MPPALAQVIPQSKDAAGVVWAIIGYSLVAILIYLLLEKNIANALGGAGGMLAKAAQGWVKPVDPLQAFTSSAAEPVASSSSTTGSLPELAPAPSSIANEPVSKLKASQANNAFFNLYREKVDHQKVLNTNA